MRKLLSLTALAGLMVFLANAAQAQRQGGLFGRGGGGQALLLNKSVQEELKITDEQKNKLQEVARAGREKMQEITGKIDFKDKESFAKLKEIFSDPKNQEKMREYQQAQQKELLAVLNADQQKRLKQIERQQLGLRAFANEEVIKELNVTDDQKEKLKTIAAEIDKDADELRKDRENFRENRKKIEALRKEGMEKVEAVLTAEQKTKWKEMVGTPFEVRFEGFGGNFGKGGFKGKGKKQDD